MFNLVFMSIVPLFTVTVLLFFLLFLVFLLQFLQAKIYMPHFQLEEKLYLHVHVIFFDSNSNLHSVVYFTIKQGGQMPGTPN